MNRGSSLPNATLISRHKTSNLNRVTFEECMNKFFELEMLPETELLTCDYCRRKSNVSKQTAIYSLPKILVIHLKRFVFSEQQMDFEKINDIVEIR
jgi:ubiquitin C-terminal hydrolase